MNATFSGGMRIGHVYHGADIACLTLRVTTRYASNDSPSSIPKGPLDEMFPEGHMVLVCEDVYAAERKKELLHVYLYGKWAEKFQFITVNNIIQIWGGEDIVFGYETTMPRVKSICICLSEQNDKEIETMDEKVHTLC